MPAMATYIWNILEENDIAPITIVCLEPYTCGVAAFLVFREIKHPGGLMLKWGLRKTTQNSSIQGNRNLYFNISGVGDSS